LPFFAGRLHGETHDAGNRAMAVVYTPKQATARVVGDGGNAHKPMKTSYQLII
jgi:hypothetical protein